MTMRTSGASDSRKNSNEKRVPENAKYAHIGARLDTGSTQAKVKYLTNRQVLRRRDETFLRISRDDLVELFEEYEKIDDERVADNVRGGDENGPKVCVYDEDDKAEYDRPYLVLDVRTTQEFEACHMLQARSMPQRLLMQDKVHAEMYKFRNREGKLIVLYDDQERLAAAAAHQLVHRGFDNVFILTRGLCGFAENYPHYVEGDVAALPRAPESPQKKRSSSSSSSSSSSRGGPGSTTSRRPLSTSSRAGSSMRGGPSIQQRTMNRGRATQRDEDQLSRFSELSVADSVISRAQSRKTRL